MHLAKIGEDLINKGYQILPIKPNQKRPKDSGWTTKIYDIAWLDKAITNGCADCGVGIKAKYTPAVDIDTDIVDLQEKILDYLFDTYGSDYTRYGRRPLVMFRTDKPFKKITSAKYFDDKGGKHQIEILADGQQFVIGGIHPETNKEYSIIDNYIPPVEDLPILNESDAISIINYCENLMGSYKGLYKSEKLELKNSADNNMEKKLPLLLADWQVDEYIKGSGLDVNDYDDWIKVGMCLYHQYSGSHEGLLIWDGWSSSGNSYKPHEMQMKWDSFSGEDKGLTFRTIIKYYNELNKKESKSKRDAAAEDIKKAETGTEIIDHILPKYKGLLNESERETISQLAKSTYKELEGHTYSIATIRSLLISHDAEDTRDLSWCENWVFLIDDNKFFNTISDSLSSVSAFNTLYANRVERGEGKPAEFAVSNGHIYAVNNIMYMPTEQGTFFRSNKEYLNTYREHHLKATEINNEAVNLFKKHCELLIPDERERHIFKNFLGHTIKNAGDRINWGVLLQGDEGNGKSFFEVIMRKILGEYNVNTVSNTLVKSDFNEWAYGSCLNVLSELKITGDNRHSIYNNIKPYLTDEEVSLNIKGLRYRRIVNTANYIITTNFKDAAPINKKDRRLLVIFTTADIQDSDYYFELFETCKANPYSIKQYLINLDNHPDFIVKGRAPVTKHHSEMVSYNRDPIEVIIDEAIEDKNNMFITSEFVAVGVIKTELEIQGYGKYSPNRITNKLRNSNYQSVGRLKFKGENYSFWSKNGLLPMEKIKFELQKSN